MEKVTGIGGLFFRSRDPEALACWYRDHLGIPLVPKSEGEQAWQTQAGTTVFAPFAENTKYFGNASKMWMINFRVGNLEAMAKQLRDDGIQVEMNPEDDSIGRFARLNDPEGNPIELWEPKQDA
jgi:glyoxylase I family protein